MTTTRALVIGAAAALACAACSSSSNGPNIDASIPHDGPADAPDAAKALDGGGDVAADVSDAPLEAPVGPTLTATLVTAIGLLGPRELSLQVLFRESQLSPRQASPGLL